MDLIYATKDFKIKGVEYDGFPLILDNEMNLIPAPFEFLIYHCITRGRVQSRQSWATYGQGIYDYYLFLDANNWNWRDISVSKESTILATYRDYSVQNIGLSSSTVNYRLRLIIRFYQYAQRMGWVHTLPYTLENVIVRQSNGFLAHTDTSGGIKASPNVLLKSKKTEIEVLSIEQVKAFLNAISNPTQLLMARMALQTGLRKMELCTFPLKYVQNPADHSRIVSKISVLLDERDMRLKNSKPRTIDVPVKLMFDLWQYVIHERFQVEKLFGEKQSVLFLNKNGEPYKPRTLNSVWNKLDLPFKVYPHILRHTYATHTLYELRKKKGSGIDPLLYVRDRLGHSSITTTQKYFHFLNQIEDDVMNEYQNEIDCLGTEYE